MVYRGVQEVAVCPRCGEARPDERIAASGSCAACMAELATAETIVPSVRAAASWWLWAIVFAYLIAAGGSWFAIRVFDSATIVLGTMIGGGVAAVAGFALVLFVFFRPANRRALVLAGSRFEVRDGVGTVLHRGSIAPGAVEVVRQFSSTSNTGDSWWYLGLRFRGTALIIVGANAERMADDAAMRIVKARFRVDEPTWDRLAERFGVRPITEA